ncbi:TOBE domain-containing protein [Desulfolutivibrio sulfoxidireducens]|uniref:TOBE domain-containing protein n=1 Tax=Desulfolutivibrio sulfoxidireducens TaxID=2773299 RepID=UPI00159E0A66|nr:TOBE domain-containing protein [Desulfolutivibrio sulfoxidireducens]QLA15305.1 tyrosine-type recombinase/integrase [Desulfolutivibrio sulfoxidireducens]
MAGSRDTADAPPGPASSDGPPRQAAAFFVPGGVKHLDTLDLERLAESFTLWAAGARRADSAASRRRVRLIFLVIRHTGARLGEVLAIDDRTDIDLSGGVLVFGGGEGEARREVRLPEVLSRELTRAMADPGLFPFHGRLFHLDQGFVRRKFYERATACGLQKDMANPSALRRSRAIELMRQGAPLLVVQKILGHSTPVLTASYLDFSEKDRRRIERRVLAREAKRKTSARNSFYGKVTRVLQGDMQSIVEIATLGGHSLISVITNESLDILHIRPGTFLTAEIKAPFVVVTAGPTPPATSAENVFCGVVEKVVAGELTGEALVRLADGTRICAAVTAESVRALGLSPGDTAFASCNAFAVVLRAD